MPRPFNRCFFFFFRRDHKTSVDRMRPTWLHVNRNPQRNQDDHRQAPRTLRKNSGCGATGYVKGEWFFIFLL